MSLGQTSVSHVVGDVFAAHVWVVCVNIRGGGEVRVFQFGFPLNKGNPFVLSASMRSAPWVFF